MLDPSRIKARIEEINNRVAALNEEFKPLSEKKLIESYSLNAAAEHHLQTAVQACIDIASHIISAFLFKRPDEVSEVFQTLAKEKIIPQGLANKLTDSAKYRNVIVHLYLGVDRHKTYGIIQNHLPDLSEFAKYIEEFLEKQEKKET